jgi:superfamily II DNA or RNA helicase
LTQDDEFFKLFSMVIYDEIHAYCSDKRRRIFRKLLPVSIGMSATTNDRTDGFDVIYEKELAIDGIIQTHELKGWQKTSTKFKINVNIIYYNGPPSHTKLLKNDSTDDVSTSKMHTQFLEDKIRMQVIKQQIKQLYDKGHHIFIFADERNHVMSIKALLSDLINDDEIEVDLDDEIEIDLVDKYYKLYTDDIDFENDLLTYLTALEHQLDNILINIGPSIDSESDTQGIKKVDKEIGCFMGGLQDKQSRQMKKEARILITTYGFSSTGISLPKMTAILFATSRKAKMKQIIGRILREGGNNEHIEREIIDIVDSKTFLRRHLIDRLQAYDFYHAKIYRSKIKYEDFDSSVDSTVQHNKHDDNQYYTMDDF